MIRAVIITSAALALALAEGGAAQTTRPQSLPLPSPGPAFEVTMTAGVWLPRLGGKARLGPSASAQRIDLAERFGLHDTE
ncbi:MAG: hypothetical protein V3T07_09360, partial [Myxococcota bacterium]